MRFRISKVRDLTSVVAILLCFLGLAGGHRIMAQGTVLYTAAIASSKGRSITVRQSGKEILISLQGFKSPIEVKADGGGVSTCRTVLEHNSPEASILLSLAIPDPRAACRMLPSFIAVESRHYDISLDDAALKKTTGSNARIRAAVQRIFGRIPSEGEE